MDNLFPPGRGRVGGGSFGHPGDRQHTTPYHSDMGSQCRRCPMDRCIVPPGAGGHASRLLIAQPELDPLQPASLPMLETLRAGFWRRGGTLSCWLRGVNRGGFTFIRAPERFSFHPAVNIGSPPIAHVLGAMKSSCDPRSQAQVVRSKQPAYSLALQAVCMTVGRINQPLARWSVNYPGAFLNRLGTRRNWATLELTSTERTFVQ